jgi:hypothetical protein
MTHEQRLTLRLRRNIGVVQKVMNHHCVLIVSLGISMSLVGFLCSKFFYKSRELTMG